MHPRYQVFWGNNWPQCTRPDRLHLVDRVPSKAWEGVDYGGLSEDKLIQLDPPKEEPPHPVAQPALLAINERVRQDGVFHSNASALCQ